MSKKYIILAGIIFLAAIGGFSGYKKIQKKNLTKAPILADKKNNLTTEQEKVFLDKISKGQEYLKSIMPNKPDSAIKYSSAYVYLAQQYFGMGKLQKSKELFELALQKDPSSQGAVEGLVLTLLAAGDKTSANKLLENFLKNYPKSVNVWLQYFEISASLNKSNQEIAISYEKALAETDRNINIITSFAGFEERAGNIEKAIALWQEAGEKYQSNVQIYENEINRLKQLNK